MSKKSRFKKLKFREENPGTNTADSSTQKIHEPKKSKTNSIRRFYFENLTKALYITLFLLFISMAYIGYTIYSTGDFVKKGVSLKGGIAITIMSEDKISVEEFKDFLSTNFPKADYSVISYSSSGKQQGLIAEISGVEIKDLISKITQQYGIKEGEYTIEETGSVLGQSFFSQTLTSMIIAFLLMGLVVFWYFGDTIKSKLLLTLLTFIVVGILFSGLNLIKTIIAITLIILIFYLFITRSIPSFAVIFAGFSTLIMTLAVFNLLDLRLTTAGIAAFLMLIGYSVDTDILLTTRVLKNKDETDFEENVISSIKTGLTMTLSAMAAVLTAYFFSQSEMLKQIMLILFIGLCFDIINTWIQNVAVIKLYVEHHKKQH